ncbi:MAG: hypothetical protein ACR2HY_05525 [Acidimicrobiales bacterium]
MSEDEAVPSEKAMAPDETARAFVDAVVWGEHRRVWDLLGLEGRTTVLKVAANRGMDEVLVARLRDGMASGAEREEFLADLVNGLRADLAGNDLDALEYELDAAPAEPGRSRVVIQAPLNPLLGGYLPAASVELSNEAGSWKVERLVPLTSQ